MEKYKTADLSQKEIEVETQKENRKDEFGKKIKHIVLYTSSALIYDIWHNIYFCVRTQEGGRL